MSFRDTLPPRIQQMPAYPYEKPVQELEREIGVPMVQLGLNENPFGPSPKAIEAIRACLQDTDRYPDDTGYYLRQKLAASFDVSIDEVIIGVGVSDILAMAYQALLAPGTQVLTSEGSFIVYYVLAAITGTRIVCTPLKDFAFDLDAMAEQLSSKTRLIVIANPNNPTGTIIRRGTFDAFMKKVPQDVVVIMDEAYFEYVLDPEYPDSFEYLRSGHQVLILRTFSKAFGLAGLRVGYGIGTRELIETLYKVRMPFCTSTTALVGALAAWDDQEHVEKSVRLNRSELEFLSMQLSSRHVKYIPSFTNFLLLDLGESAEEVGAGLLQQGVVVRPMAAWGLPAGVRVSVGTREQNMRFLNALEKLL